MGGTLCAAVVADDCYWEMVDGVLMLVLAKVRPPPPPATRTRPSAPQHRARSCRPGSRRS